LLNPVALAVAAATSIIIAGKCLNVNTFFEFFSDFFNLFIFLPFLRLFFCAELLFLPCRGMIFSAFGAEKLFFLP